MLKKHQSENEFVLDSDILFTELFLQSQREEYWFSHNPSRINISASSQKNGEKQKAGKA